MGLGHTTGDAALLTENNLGAYDANVLSAGSTAWTVHEALMGDPTLRMRPFVAPATVSLSEDHVANSVTLMWTASSSLLGYNVYRASVKANHYTLLTPTPITVGTFTDTLPMADSAYYLVRGVRDETTPSGNYLNLAYGATALSKGGFIDAGVDPSIARDGLSVIYPLAGSVATIVLDASSSFRGRIDILDVQGRTVASLANGEIASGTSHFDWDFARVSGGVYFVRVIGSKEPLVAKIVVR
jgi:hypothetical protein